MMCLALPKQKRVQECGSMSAGFNTHRQTQPHAHTSIRLFVLPLPT
uniref:Macaca fascicularis brain cDNA clone: QflA-16625, similar to human ubiquitination factor E4B (UFD2 homolog, yeast) (UBE4B), mRNA, RefSeq: NM_006048.2 n=1 Tax=Macaca fascicularis TaxID=9541 RepID=I7GMD0_MACFA|nr:unnamed protein product [Macaca fascicularis]